MSGWIRSFVVIFAAVAVNAVAEVPAPVLNPEGGVSGTYLDVSISCATTGATIRFTTDGTDPDESSREVPANGHVRVARNLTLKAQAWANGEASAITEAGYLVPGEIAAGSYHVLALKFNQTKLYSWASNSSGQLGRTILDSGSAKIPARVELDPTLPDADPLRYLSGVKAIAAGASHSVALLNSGTVLAWGGNGSGQLGNGTLLSGSIPTTMISGLVNPGAGQPGDGQPMTDVISIAAWGGHTFVIRSNGEVWSCGDNQYGDLGQGTSLTDAKKLKPVRVSGTAGAIFTAVKVAVGSSHAMALDANGHVWTWGDRNHGECGDGVVSSTARKNPYQLPESAFAISGTNYLVQDIDAGGWDCGAVTSDGSVWMWGVNDHCSAGNGGLSSDYNQATPLRVVADAAEGDSNAYDPVSGKYFLSDIVAISVGQTHSLAIKKDGSVWGWGNNGYGNLGHGTGSIDYNYAVRMLNPDGTPFKAAAVSAGYWYSVMLADDGKVYTAGSNTYGQHGTTTATHLLWAYPNPRVEELGNHAPSILLSSTNVLTGSPSLLLTLTGSDSDQSTQSLIFELFKNSALYCSGTGSPFAVNVGYNELSSGTNSFDAYVFDEAGEWAKSSYEFALPNGDGDGDGLNDLWELQNGLNPLVSDENLNGQQDGLDDFDGDGLTNAQEELLGFFPLSSDSNNDGILDTFQDSDGDGFPDSFELAAGSDKDNPNSFPVPDVVLDPANPESPSLQEAIDSRSSDFGIIELADGNYTGPISIPSRVVMIYSQNGACSTQVDLQRASGGFHVSRNCLIRGLTIKNGFSDVNDASGAGGNVFVESASPLFQRCVITSGEASTGAAVTNLAGQPLFDHCTISGNSGGSAVCNVGGTSTFRSCILWNPTTDAEFEGDNSEVAYSVVRGGAQGLGNLDSDPLLSADFHIGANSSARNPANAYPCSVLDMDGESSDGVADIGADEYVDSEPDGIADWWEVRYFGSASACNGSDDPDHDGRTNLTEFAAGSDPWDFYNEEVPLVQIVNPQWGNNQTGEPGRFAMNSLQVLVTGSAGLIANAPVTFTVVSGDGKIGAGMQNLQSTVQLTTSANGTATVYFQFGSTAGIDTEIRVTAGTAASLRAYPVSFIEHCVYPALATSDWRVPVVIHLQAVSQGTGLHLSWSENCINEDSFRVESSVDGKAWQNVGDAPADSGAFDVVGVDQSKLTIYRVLASNQRGQVESNWISNKGDFPFTDDTDGDLYPDIYEVLHGSDALSAGSTPAPDIIVDCAGNGNYKDLQSAFDGANPCDIILVRAGVYRGVKNRELINFSRLMIISESGATHTVFDAEGQSGVLYADAALVGLRFTNCIGSAVKGVENRIVDCVFDHNYGTVFDDVVHCVNSAYYPSLVVNCTVVDNAYSSELWDWASPVYIEYGIVQNTVFWNNMAGDVSCDRPCSTVASYCDAGEVWVDESVGNFYADPVFAPDYHLTIASPCRDHGDPAVSVLKDMDNEPRPSDGALCDVGADEWVDGNNNSLPDFWEQEYLAEVQSPSASGDDDGDGISNYDEYLAGTDPLDFYNGAVPSLTVVDGTGTRFGQPNEFLTSPIIVQVTVNGQPTANAPVWFTATQFGGGGVAGTSETGVQVSGSQMVHADQNGLARVYYRLPEVCGWVNRITATSRGSTTPAVPVTALSADDGKHYTYDAEGRLTDSIIRTSGTTSIGYDENGNILNVSSSGN